MKADKPKINLHSVSWFFVVHLFQLGSTAIGIQTSEGVCLAVEKRITSPLMEPSSIEKIVEIDTHIGRCNPIVKPCFIKTLQSSCR